MADTKKKVLTIDANGKSIGRIATEAVKRLQGKHMPNWAPNTDSGQPVEVVNIAAAKIIGEKMKQKKYYHYSGYPGGLKTKPMREIWEKDPAEVLRRAVWQMLPKTKLRRAQFFRLKIN
ncbi:50S ribosomal protein L13 [Candidatus Uhrbacteria bacterium CG10_big_fil_rev_8_21_14_0_10_48_11]|uniref:Large ribosomal subunit protein uL13 n=1 Tax=Candidatus Uhrbacteria bacterium CG10_big_fil_rev_8_21_14_0_10_48_11 TaxID=1975037 RepID=A0A2M8LEC6_9BACT|nr:MAG: 50S ribosomal protein L13 [Candidatus Uhrbacteria bacterium CG10_big_fil_rev_8_21_14_0_10_48_11]